jgi:hypothetical protein
MAILQSKARHRLQQAGAARWLACANPFEGGWVGGVNIAG